MHHNLKYCDFKIVIKYKGNFNLPSSYLVPFVKLHTLKELISLAAQGF